MSKTFKLAVWVLLLGTSYHLIRDVLQDIIGFHHPLVDIFHREPKRELFDLGQNHNFWGIPFEVAVIILSIKSLTSKRPTIWGGIAIILFAILVSLWIWSIL